jgi:hypothetical protein
LNIELAEGPIAEGAAHGDNNIVTRGAPFARSGRVVIEKSKKDSSSPILRVKERMEEN